MWHFPTRCSLFSDQSLFSKASALRDYSRSRRLPSRRAVETRIGNARRCVVLPDTKNVSVSSRKQCRDDLALLQIMKVVGPLVTGLRAALTVCAPSLPPASLAGSSCSSCLNKKIPMGRIQKELPGSHLTRGTSPSPSQ